MIPVIVVSGYLGAGKTSLINHILRQEGGPRAGVLVNDFGALNVDAALIENRDGTTIAMQNGCVCCSIADDLLAGLDLLLKWPAPLDAVLIEASGVADPGKIALLANTSTRLDPGGVLCLVDALQIRRQSRDKYIAMLIRRQLHRADLLILNKADEISAADVEALQDWLDDLSGGTPILTTTHGAIPTGCLAVEPGKWDIEAETFVPPRFQRLRIDLPVSMSFSSIKRKMDRLPQGLYRLKGMIPVNGEPHLLQCVGPQWSLTAWPKHAAPMQPALIGIAAQTRAASVMTWLSGFAGR